MGFRNLSTLAFGLFFCKQCHSVCTDALFPSRESKSFGGGSFDADIFRVNAHHQSHDTLHFWNMRIELWPLRTDC